MLRTLAVVAVICCSQTALADEPKWEPDAAHKKALASMIKELKKIHAWPQFVSDADIKPRSPDTLRILMTGMYQMQPKRQRLALIEALWQRWAVHNQANQPDVDMSKIEVLGPTGRKVGGSSWGGGRDIRVDDD